MPCVGPLALSWGSFWMSPPPVEQQQSYGSLKHQTAFEASAGAVVPVVVGPHVGAALMTPRLDVVGFRNTVKTRFADVLEIAVE